MNLLVDKEWMVTFKELWYTAQCPAGDQKRLMSFESWYWDRLSFNIRTDVMDSGLRFTLIRSAVGTKLSDTVSML